MHIIRSSNCKICNEKIDVSNWVSSIDFVVWGIVEDGSKEEHLGVEELDVCYECFMGLKTLLHIMKSFKMDIFDLKDAMHKLIAKRKNKKGGSL